MGVGEGSGMRGRRGGIGIGWDGRRKLDLYGNVLLYSFALTKLQPPEVLANANKFPHNRGDLFTQTNHIYFLLPAPLQP